MPRVTKDLFGKIDAPYFSSLTELDTWAAGATNQKLDGVLKYVPRPDTGSQRGKLLVCHDYKGGYTEDPSARSYTFNFWPSCDTFVYFSHHRVTVPPPGWITAAHRQGAKILGTLIFEGDGEEDCLRLLVGHLPSSVYGPAKATPGSVSLPLSSHYAKLLAELAAQRGFDGYLLNFEVPLRGGVEQSRTLAAWITVLQSEILAKVGRHGETHWYDSVIFTGQLAWQDRLNSFNLPFFLSSTTIFTNYTWPTSYPVTVAEYFLSLDPALTGNAPNSQPQTDKKTLNDIYMGVDVWGRGSYGGGGFGSYKAITRIAPDSLGLSVALFAQGWTWETEQDKPGFTWESWWEYDRKLWVGPISGEVEVPGGSDGPEGPFQPIANFFPRYSPPDPFDLPLHTTFSPGVGLAWFVNGVNVHQTIDGWTDLDKQCSLGDQLWPRPAVDWQDGERDIPLPQILSSISFDDAWNGGSSVSLDISCLGSEKEDAVFRSIWVPVQTLSVTAGKVYGATLCYKVADSGQAEVDLGTTVKQASPNGSPFEVQPGVETGSTELPGGWSKISIQFSVASQQADTAYHTGAIGLVVVILTEDATKDFDVKISIGQLNVYAIPPPNTAVSIPAMLWADFATPASKDAPGRLSWEVAASFPPLGAITITSPNDPISAWPVQPSNSWFPQFMYFNVYALLFSDNDHVGQPEEAAWIGTTGWVGRGNSLDVVPNELPFWSEVGAGKTKVRFYIQGVTDHGLVLEWDKCIFVDSDFSALFAT